MAKKTEEKTVKASQLDLTIGKLDKVCLPIVKGIKDTIGKVSIASKAIAAEIKPHKGIISVKGYIEHIGKLCGLSTDNTNTLLTSVRNYLKSKPKTSGMKTLVVCPHCNKKFNLLTADKVKVKK